MNLANTSRAYRQKARQQNLQHQLPSNKYVVDQDGERCLTTLFLLPRYMYSTYVRRYLEAERCRCVCQAV